jgi:hypothetical protein
MSKQTIEQLDKRITAIERRNHRVEADKAWEGSYTRRVLIIVFTYIAIGLYLKFVLNVEPLLNAIVPATGFLLSTLSLPFFKRLWVEYLYRKSR